MSGSELRARLHALTANLRNDPITSKLFAAEANNTTVSPASTGQPHGGNAFSSPAPAAPKQLSPSALQGWPTVHSTNVNSTANTNNSSSQPGAETQHHQQESPSGGIGGARSVSSAAATANTSCSVFPLSSTQSALFGGGHNPNSLSSAASGKLAPKPHGASVRNLVLKYLRARQERLAEEQAVAAVAASSIRKKTLQEVVSSATGVAPAATSTGNSSSAQQQQHQRPPHQRHHVDASSPDPVRPSGPGAAHVNDNVSKQMSVTTPDHAIKNMDHVVGVGSDGQAMMGRDRDQIIVADASPSPPRSEGGGVVILDASPAHSSPSSQTMMKMDSMAVAGLTVGSNSSFSFGDSRTTGAAAQHGHQRMPAPVLARAPPQAPVTVQIAHENTIRLQSTMSWRHSHSRLDALVLSMVHSIAHDAPIALGE